MYISVYVLFPNKIIVAYVKDVLINFIKKFKKIKKLTDPKFSAVYFSGYSLYQIKSILLFPSANYKKTVELLLIY